MGLLYTFVLTCCETAELPLAFPTNGYALTVTYVLSVFPVNFKDADQNAAVLR